ncbi:MAG: NOG1 family protein [Halobacteriota archaeon]
MFDIPTVPTAQELLDKAFRRSVRARAGKRAGRRADKAMILTASNILVDNLRMVVRRFPNFDEIDKFYSETIDTLVGLDKLKMSLSSVNWAASKIYQLSRAAIGRLDRAQDPVVTRKQVYGRIGSIMKEIAPDLDFLINARNTINGLPHITNEPTILVAGYPNVGKSSFVSRVTNARPQIASYPFTTKGVLVGHIQRDHQRYQIVDLPGLLDRPLNKRNPIELQAITALKHLGDAVLFVIDPTGSCGYDPAEQSHLLDELRSEITLPFVVAINKADLVSDTVTTKGYHMSTKTGQGIGVVLDRLLNKAAEHKTCARAQNHGKSPQKDF